jgi:hypothetical protein
MFLRNAQKTEVFWHPLGSVVALKASN